MLADKFGALVPSPLVGEGGFAKRRRVRGCLGSDGVEREPLTRVSLWLMAELPSPTRGEGTAMFIVIAKKLTPQPPP